MKEKIAKLKERISNTPSEIYFIGLVALYSVAVVMSNVFEMKFIGTAEYTIAGGGILLSWILFAAMDLITEVWDKKRATQVLTFAVLVNVIIVLIAQLLIILPGPYDEQNIAFKQIMSNGPRTLLASMLAMWLSGYINIMIMHIMKTRTRDKNHSGFFVFRSTISTLVGQFIDNTVFLLIAFAPIGLSIFEIPVKDILTSATTGALLETLMEIVFVIFIAKLVKVLRNKIVKEQGEINAKN